MTSVMIKQAKRVSLSKNALKEKQEEKIDEMIKNDDCNESVIRSASIRSSDGSCYSYSSAGTIDEYDDEHDDEHDDDDDFDEIIDCSQRTFKSSNTKSASSRTSLSSLVATNTTTTSDSDISHSNHRINHINGQVCRRDANNHQNIHKIALQAKQQQELRQHQPRIQSHKFLPEISFCGSALSPRQSQQFLSEISLCSSHQQQQQQSDIADDEEDHHITKTPITKNYIDPSPSFTTVTGAEIEECYKNSNGNDDHHDHDNNDNKSPQRQQHLILQERQQQETSFIPVNFGSNIEYDGTISSSRPAPPQKTLSNASLFTFLDLSEHDNDEDNNRAVRNKNDHDNHEQQSSDDKKKRKTVSSESLISFLSISEEEEDNQQGHENLILSASSSEEEEEEEGHQQERRSSTSNIESLSNKADGYSNYGKIHGDEEDGSVSDDNGNLSISEHNEGEEDYDHDDYETDESDDGSMLSDITDNNIYRNNPSNDDAKLSRLQQLHKKNICMGIASRQTILNFQNAKELEKLRDEFKDSQWEPQPRHDQSNKDINNATATTNSNHHNSQIELDLSCLEQIMKTDETLRLRSRRMAKERQGEQESLGSTKTLVDHGEFEPSLMDEVQDYVAMSMFIYIYALLREMSLLGYTDVPFDEIDVNRCFDNDDDDGTIHTEQTNTTADTAESLMNTRTAGSVIRVVLEELEHHYNEEKRRNSLTQDDMTITKHDRTIISEFNHWVIDSRIDKPDDTAELAIKELKRKVARARWRRLRTIVRVNARLRLLGGMASGKIQTEEDDNKAQQNKKRPSIQEELQERRKSIEQEQKQNGTGDNPASWFNVQRKLIESHFGCEHHGNLRVLRRNSMDRSSESRHRQQSRRNAYTSMHNEELHRSKPNIHMIDKTLEDTLPSFFKKGSVLSRMMEQGIEIVYVGDRHPNEAIYCICINRLANTVTVIFRGSVTAHNWAHNLKFMGTERVNPISQESYKGNTDKFMLHTGFGLYLLRRRKDNDMNKIEEIFEKVHKIGLQLDPSGNYKVTITGHSLGGALSTILSFYAACDERFTSVAPVRVFTFAAPRVGDQRFLDAYSHLERTGRLRHARCFNTYDAVPLVPFVSMEGFKVGLRYKHVGMQIRIHDTDYIGKLRIKNSLDITYPSITSNNWWEEVKRIFLMSIFTNLTSLQNFGKNHKLSEYQRRLRFMAEYRSCLAQTDLRHCGRRSKIKSLEDYYRIRARMLSYDDEDEEKEIANPFNNKAHKSLWIILGKIICLSIAVGGSALAYQSWAETPIEALAASDVEKFVCDDNSNAAIFSSIREAPEESTCTIDDSIRSDDAWDVTTEKAFVTSSPENSHLFMDDGSITIDELITDKSSDVIASDFATKDTPSNTASMSKVLNFTDEPPKDVSNVIDEPYKDIFGAFEFTPVEDDITSSPSDITHIVIDDGDNATRGMTEIISYDSTINTVSTLATTEPTMSDTSSTISCGGVISVETEAELVASDIIGKFSEAFPIDKRLNVHASKVVPWGVVSREQLRVYDDIVIKFAKERVNNRSSKAATTKFSEEVGVVGHQTIETMDTLFDDFTNNSPPKPVQSNNPYNVLSELVLYLLGFKRRTS